jgi:heterodisulfide reductase subunit A
MMTKKHKMIAILITQLEGNLEAGLDIGLLARRLGKLKHVAMVEVQPYPGTRSEIEGFASALAGRPVDGVVVAGCSERLFGRMFRDIFSGAEIDRSSVEFADIYGQCVLAHRRSNKKATSCAEGLIGLAVSRVRAAEAREKIEAEVKPSCAVIGGGIAGMSAATALKARGVQVWLVEKEKAPGGLLNRLNAVFPAYVAAADFVGARMKRLEEAGVEVITGAEPVKVSGHVGDYRLELSNGRELEAGTIIVATGAEVLEPEGIFGYGSIDNVITHIQLENMLFEGGDPGSDIVMIQCAGSRNEERPYCSRVCCTASIKNTILIKERHPQANITILSRGFAEYAGDLDRAREMGVEIIRYSLERPPSVEAGQVTVYDEISDIEVRLPFEHVVLAAPLVASQSTRDLAAILRVPTDEYGFMLEAHLKIRPEEFAPRGIFVAGSAHWPSTITEAMLQGYGAASRAHELISAGKVVRESHVSRVDEAFCRGCGRCYEECRHGAIEFVDDEDGMKIARVMAIQCTGCGVCVSVCPSGAIKLGGMSPLQTDLTIEAVTGVRG